MDGAIQFYKSFTKYLRNVDIDKKLHTDRAICYFCKERFEADQYDWLNGEDGVKYPVCHECQYNKWD